MGIFMIGWPQRVVYCWGLEAKEKGSHLRPLEWWAGPLEWSFLGLVGNVPRPRDPSGGAHWWLLMGHDELTSWRVARSHLNSEKGSGGFVVSSFFGRPTADTSLEVPTHAKPSWLGGEQLPYHPVSIYILTWLGPLKQSTFLLINSALSKAYNTGRPSWVFSGHLREKIKVLMGQGGV